MVGNGSKRGSFEGTIMKEGPGLGLGEVFEILWYYIIYRVNETSGKFLSGL